METRSITLQRTLLRHQETSSDIAGNCRGTSRFRGSQIKKKNAQTHLWQSRLTTAVSATANTAPQQSLTREVTGSTAAPARLNIPITSSVDDSIDLTLNDDESVAYSTDAHTSQQTSSSAERPEYLNIPGSSADNPIDLTISDDESVTDTTDEITPAICSNITDDNSQDPRRVLHLWTEKTKTSNQQEIITCTICQQDNLQAFTPGSITFGECFHSFHTECITPWIDNFRISDAITCPNCREKSSIYHEIKRQPENTQSKTECQANSQTTNTSLSPMIEAPSTSSRHSNTLSTSYHNPVCTYCDSRLYGTAFTTETLDCEHVFHRKCIRRDFTAQLKDAPSLPKCRSCGRIQSFSTVRRFFDNDTLAVLTSARDRNYRNKFMTWRKVAITAAKVAISAGIAIGSAVALFTTGKSL